MLVFAHTDQLFISTHSYWDWTIKSLPIAAWSEAWGSRGVAVAQGYTPSTAALGRQRQPDGPQSETLS